MMRSRKYSWTRKLFFASFLVVCTSADPLRWLSRRDFVYDTTGLSNNMQTEAEGIELEFGQQRDLRIQQPTKILLLLLDCDFLLACRC